MSNKKEILKSRKNLLIVIIIAIIELLIFVPRLQKSSVVTLLQMTVSETVNHFSNSKKKVHKLSLI